MIKLKEILEKGSKAISASSVFLGQQMEVLDCSGVQEVTEAEMSLLFESIPPEWDDDELGKVIATETLTPAFGSQMLAWVMNIKGEGSSPFSPNVQPPSPQARIVSTKYQTPSSGAQPASADQPAGEPLEAARSMSVSEAHPLHPIKILDQVTQSYREYLQTEFRARDSELKSALDKALDTPKFLAQEPFFQAHRPFKSGSKWQNLPIDSRLAHALEKRSGSQTAYLHQSESINHLLGDKASSLVVTTGTGSGKTESFLVPVIQNAIEDAVRFKQSGLTAILVYPMNALANDQLQRIEEYLKNSKWAGAIKVAKYDRSTKQAEREALRREPPHLLLTNYMMLEYLLVRPSDREAMFANHRCRFLVLDEVHTYRGTLGSNIALLVRRLNAHLQQAVQDWNLQPAEQNQSKRYPKLLPIGTSATIKSIADDSLPHSERVRLRDAAVQDFFGKLTGAVPSTIRVVGEELEEIQTPREAVYPAVLANIEEPDVKDADAIAQAVCSLAGQASSTPLESAAQQAKILWDLNHWLIRAPMSLQEIVNQVRAVPERSHAEYEAVYQEVSTALVAGAALPEGTPGALRLRAHKFIRGGWRFHRCIDPNCGKLYPMGEEYCDCGHSTAPLHLCRNCGAHYLRFVGEDAGDPAQGVLRPSAIAGEEHEWMLFDRSRFSESISIDEDDEINDTLTARKKRGNRRQTQQMKGRPVVEGSFDPQNLAFSEKPEAYPYRVTLAPGRTRCLCCGGTAGSRNVINSVALGTSAAVKVLGESLVEALAESHQDQHDHDGKERLLIFSDSRQDAAHQARFISFASRYDRMRRRLVQILKEQGPLSIQKTVVELGALGADNQDNPYVQGGLEWLSDEAKQKVHAWEEAPLLDEISVNAGYRATLVNLGLVGVKYERIEEYIQQFGEGLSQKLKISKEELTYVCRCLLDEIRIRGCLSRDLLRYHPTNPRTPGFVQAAQWERRVKAPRGYALSPEGNPIPFLDKNEVSTGITPSNPWRKEGAGGRSPSLQRILQHLVNRLGGTPEVTSSEMVQLLDLLLRTPPSESGKRNADVFLKSTELNGYRDTTTLLQVNDERVRLYLLKDDERLQCQICKTPVSGAEAGLPCPSCEGQLVHRLASDISQNRYVQRIQANTIVPLIAKEHTAQIPNDERIEIEADFKASAAVSPTNTLACSPTLEMGIDVGGLDAVVMRNVPPRPDNYAQRGGRAGRRTRVGLVISYARSTPHDQYFYDQPAEMIAGEVPAPALALGNRDVIFRHLNAIAFSAAEPGLAGRMLDYVSPIGEINQAAVDELIAGIQAQTEHAINLATGNWESNILTEADLDEKALRQNLEQLPAQIQDVVDRTARQVTELRAALEVYSQELQRKGEAIRAGDLISRILGMPTSNRSATNEANDRSAGYPLRRFAEFGILPGYEFPTQPAAVRLLGDPREADPISVARRFGINQFRPDAQVYARTHRWRVIGLDNASPWNPRTDTPSWVYQQCRTCDLRFESDEPHCPRCKSSTLGKGLPSYEFAGFLAKRDEGPILDEEERYAARNLVSTFPQWDGQIIGRWSVGPNWSLQLSRDENVRWVNEGLKPTPKDFERETPILHSEAKGFLLCDRCGRLLKPEGSGKKGSRRQTRKQNQADPFGHSSGCAKAGTAPAAVAISTVSKAEVLRLILFVPSEINPEELRSWGISLGYALKAGMQHQYMLDGSEIDFEFEGAWPAELDGVKYKRVSLSFIDPSLGGSGYLRRIASEFHLVAQKALDHLDHPNCETACYRCLKTYQNQRFHEILCWPRVTADLKELVDQPATEVPLKKKDLDDPRPWIEAYQAGVGSPLELKFLKLFERYGFYPEKQVPVSSEEGEKPISVADFAVVEKRLAIYIDGAAFHKGENLRRDQFLRNKLRNGSAPWNVIEWNASDLSKGKALIDQIEAIT